MAITLQGRTRTRLAERLDALVREDEASTVELAAKVGMNRTTLYKWRTSRHGPSKAVATLVGLADEFGVSVDWLLGRTDVREVAGQPPERQDTKPAGQEKPMSMEELARSLGRRRGNPS